MKKARCAKGYVNTRWPGMSRVSNIQIKKIGSTLAVLVRLILAFIPFASFVTKFVYISLILGSFNFSLYS